jgi:hypothetical protein
MASYLTFFPETVLFLFLTFQELSWLMPHLILWAYGAVPELCFYKEFDLFFL